MKRLLAIAFVLLFAGVALADWVAPTGVGGRFSTQASYMRHIQIPALLTGNIGTNPTPETIQGVGCLQFDQNVGRYAFFQVEIGNDWTADSDMTLEIDWFPDGGAMSGTDTVEWVLVYRCIAEGEAINLGTAVTVTATVSDDIAQYISTHTPLTLDYDNANQPLADDDHCYFGVHRNTSVANDYNGTVCVTAFEWDFTANGLAEN